MLLPVFLHCRCQQVGHGNAQFCRVLLHGFAELCRYLKVHRHLVGIARLCQVDAGYGFSRWWAFSLLWCADNCHSLCFRFDQFHAINDGLNELIGGLIDTFKRGFVCSPAAVVGLTNGGFFLEHS